MDTASVLSSVDLLPSLLHIAGVTVPADAKPDGSDRAETLLGREKTPSVAKPIFWKRPPDRPGPPGKPFPDLAVRDGSWKFLMKQNGNRAELYDLAADPGETTNLAAKNPAVAERLKQALLAWNRTLPTQPKKP